MDQGQVLIRLEEFGILDTKVLEPLHIARLDTAHDREVRSQRFLIISM